MDRQWIEMLENMDPEALEDLLLSDGETQLCSGGRDMEHIWKQVEEKTSPKKKRRVRRIRLLSVLAAALVMGLCGTVFAAQMGYFEVFFWGEMPEGLVVVAGDSVTDDGITMTLEELLPSANGGLAVVSFKREDGQPFPEGTEVKNLQMDIEGDTSVSRGYTSEYIFNEDRTEMMICYSIDTWESISSNTLLVDAGIVQYLESNRIDYPLRDVAEADNVLIFEGRDHLEEYEEPRLQYLIQMKDDDDWLEELVEITGEIKFDAVAEAMEAFAGEAGWPWPKYERFPEFRIVGIAADEDAVYLMTMENYEGPWQRKDWEEQLDVSSLVDERTGYHINSSSVYSSTIGNSEISRTISTFYGVTAEDLPYLTLVMHYNDVHVISHGSWSVAKAVDVSQLTTEIELNRGVTVQREGGTLEMHLKEAVITPINITIKVVPSDFDRTDLDEMRPSLAAVLEDGTRIDYCSSSMSGDGDCYLMSYVREYDYYSTGIERYLSKEELAGIEYLEIEGEVFPVK